MPVNFSYEQKQLLNILPRVALIFSLPSAVYMVWFILHSRSRRSRCYHRIMLGCAIDVILYSIARFWGSAAAPVDSSVLGANGNQTTCTIQGFMHYTTIFVVPFYCASLSLLSYINVYQKFDFNRVAWIEKYLHIGSISIPVIFGCVLLSVEAFNPAISLCSFTSQPAGCGYKFFSNEKGTICTRGPQNIQQLQFFLGLVPIFCLLFFPTLVMMSLYVNILRLGRSQRKIAVCVGNQIGIYLLVILAIYLFRIIDFTMMAFTGRANYVTNLLAQTNESLNGVWILISYSWFRSNSTDELGHAGTNTADEDTNNNEEMSDRSNSNSSDAAEKTRRKSFGKPEFSIFDGGEVPTDSPWSAFLSEGIDDDYTEGRMQMQ